jgi:hypothetical protein
MPYRRPLGCRQAFGIKNKIAKTKGNQFLHLFLSPYFLRVRCLGRTFSGASAITTLLAKRGELVAGLPKKQSRSFSQPHLISRTGLDLIMLALV